MLKYILILLILLTSCKTYKTIDRSNIEVRDSVVVNYIDSVVVRYEQKDSVVIKESITLRDSVVIVRDTNGNTLSKEMFRFQDTNTSEIKILNTELDSYKAIYSSLEQKYNELESRYNEKISEKKPTLIDKLKNWMWIILGIAIGIWLLRLFFHKS